MSEFLFEEVAGEYDPFLAEVGIRRGRRRRRARRARRRMARRGGARRGRPPFQPSPLRVQTLPLGTVSIAVAPGPGATTSGRLSAVCQKPGQYNRLSLSASDPTNTIDRNQAEASILVADIRLGTVSQYSGIQETPLSTYGDRATGVQIETGIARTGTTVSVDLLNQNQAVEIAVGGAMIGVTAD